jgi:predicted ATPase/serine phosphatase RsbU (regulator of sigma subunit)
MHQLPGYQIDSELHRSDHSVVYRGRRRSDGAAVVIKFLTGRYPLAYSNAKLRQEYTLSRDLDSPAIVRAYSLEPHNGSYALVMEDFGGVALREYLAGRPQAPGEFLPIALQIVDALSVIHASTIIHKDIKPSNIIINPQSGLVKVSDFGIASLLPRENQAVGSPELLEGTLAYISPEQTGRMNRPIDYRSDFYSLGVLFYEMLTGELPFQSADPLELVHQHIARMPAPPEQRQPGIPPALARIVLKLLAKPAEERYQSAFGLRADLQECLRQLEAAGTIADFPLGRHDISERFQLPQTLYGRERELAVLLAAFAGVAEGGAAMLAVTGSSGIGKSALVHEIHKPLVARKGYFISGKFDQLKRDIPFSAFIQAFQDLIRQILSEPAARIAGWKERLLRALGPNGGIITGVIPEVELIIGPQPAVVEVGPTEEQYRFRAVFKDFIAALAQPDHPLIIFVDDLQWADSASLRLIELLLTAADTRHLLVIGAYRDNEVDASHPLPRLLETLRAAGCPLRAIAVGPLGLAHITELIADTLHCDRERASPLAQLVAARTDGNPFFVGELLKTLFQQRLLAFDQRSGRWEWDLQRIEQSGITANVVELMRQKITQLPAATQAALRLAACIGNSFKLHTLAQVDDTSTRAIAAALHPALELGLIVPVGETHRALKFLTEQASDAAVDLVEFNFRFLHDRIQEAAYALVPDALKQSVHLRIGRHLRARVEGGRLDERLFEIVNHLNIGQELLTDPAERQDLLALNLRAGQKAKKSTANDAAARYFATALGLLPADSWQSRYAETYALRIELAKIAFLQGNPEQARGLCQDLLGHARTTLEKMKVYELLIVVNASQGRFGAALDVAITALELLGIRLPRHPNQGHVVLHLIRTRFQIGLRSTAQLVHLPAMTDELRLMAMRLLVLMAPQAYQSEADLLPIIVFTMVSLSVRHGNTALSSYAYSLYGMAMNGVLGNLKAGLAYSQLALKVMERFDAQELRAKNYGMYNFFLRHWKEPLRNTVAPMLELADLASEAGDIEYQAYNYFFYCQARFVLGDSLEQLEGEFATYHAAIKRLKQDVQDNVLAILFQMVLNLRSQAADPTRLRGERFDIDALDAGTYDSAAFYAHFYQALLLYYFKQPQVALAHIRRAGKHLPGVMSMNVVPLFHFYSALIMLALYPAAPGHKKALYWARVAASQRKLAGWAGYAPANQHHRLALLRAEMARVQGDDRAAMDGYASAIAGAVEQGYTQDAALANELAAEFYLSLDNGRVAAGYLGDAYQLYGRWGATAKLRQLEQAHAQLRAPSPAGRVSGGAHDTLRLGTSDSSQGPALDLGTVIKASQAISSEVQLDKLLSRLMTSVIENAGAERGFLLLEKNGQWVIEATGAINAAEVSVGLAQPIDEQSAVLPSSVINYVARTREYVVLRDAAHEGPFTHDHYVLTRQPKSILCAPLLKQGELGGMLYLENNLNTAVFTTESLEILKLLASQAAISIDNARLYGNLESLVAARTAELRTANLHLQQLNDQLTGELALARKIQQSLLPPPSPAWPALTVLCDSTPALAVGGDFYAYHSFAEAGADGRYAVVVGDVSGKGMPAALLMGVSLASFRGAVDHRMQPAALLARLDGDLLPYTRTTRQNCALVYVDILLGAADQNRHRLRAANAGCVSPLLRCQDGAVAWLEVGGIPLGIGLGMRLGYAEYAGSFASGDLIILTSDGVVEANNAAGEMFGFSRFEQVVAAGPQDAAGMLGHLKRALAEFVGATEPHDDQTIVVIQAP